MEIFGIDRLDFPVRHRIRLHPCPARGRWRFPALAFRSATLLATGFRPIFALSPASERQRFGHGGGRKSTAPLSAFFSASWASSDLAPLSCKIVFDMRPITKSANLLQTPGEHGCAPKKGDVYIDMKQGARVRRKVLMDGRSKRSVSMPLGLPVAVGADIDDIQFFGSPTQQLETRSGPTTARWSPLQHPVPTLSLAAPPASLEGLQGIGQEIGLRAESWCSDYPNVSGVSFTRVAVAGSVSGRFCGGLGEGTTGSFPIWGLPDAKSETVSDLIVVGWRGFREQRIPNFGVDGVGAFLFNRLQRNGHLPLPPPEPPRTRANRWRDAQGPEKRIPGSNPLPPDP